MIYQEFQPSSHLAEFIKCFWIMEQFDEVENQAPEPILPDGCPEIIFNLALPFRRHHFDKTEIQPQSIVVGQMKKFVLIEPAKKIKLFGIRFHPFGLYPLIKQPLHELTETIENVETILNRAGIEIEERINEAGSTQARISIFEKMFEKTALNKRIEMDFISSATKLILESSGRIAVEKVVSEFETNFKQLERLFKNQIGLTPKRFCRTIRLQKIVQGLKESKVESWADVAVSFGYFDQAHFIKDFREFTGTTPNYFTKQSNELTDFFVS